MALIFGDGPGTLTGRGGDQVLRNGPSAQGSSVTMYGDVSTIGAGIRGGNDVLIGSFSLQTYVLIGDAHIFTGGFGGRDVLLGGHGANLNLLVGDWSVAGGLGLRGGADLLVGGNGAGTNTLIGDGPLSRNSFGGNDTLVGGTGATVLNHLVGDSLLTLEFGARGGNDRLEGGANSANLIIGDAGQIAGGRGGRDLLIGGAGGTGNRMIGDAEVVAATDRDGVVSFCGADTLVSAFDTVDVMSGDAALPAHLGRGARPGADLFVFGPFNGHDIILDFQVGRDMIRLDRVGVSSFEELSIRTVVQEVSWDLGAAGSANLGLVPTTVIEFSEYDSITLVGVAGSFLPPLRHDDILFA